MSLSQYDQLNKIMKYNSRFVQNRLEEQKEHHDEKEFVTVEPDVVLGANALPIGIAIGGVAAGIILAVAIALRKKKTQNTPSA